MGSSTKVDKGADIERRKKKLDEDFESLLYNIKCQGVDI